MKQVPLCEIQRDLSRFLHEAESEEGGQNGDKLSIDRGQNVFAMRVGGSAPDDRCEYPKGAAHREI